MEIWKVSRLDKNYEVSSIGRIRSIERVEEVTGHWGGKYKRRYGGKILNPVLNRLGYLQIIGTKKKFHQAHRLIAFEFVDGFSEGLFVNHKNGIRNDNRPENLEWVTHQQNLLHAYRELGVKGRMTGKYGSENHCSIPVVRTCMITGEKKEYGSMSCAGRDGFDTGAVSRCTRGMQKNHRGFLWEIAKA